MTTPAARQALIDQLSETLDGADIFTVLSTVADAMDFDIVFALTSLRQAGSYDDADQDAHDAPGWRICRDLIASTQSNYDEALYALEQIAVQDAMIAMEGLDDGF